MSNLNNQSHVKIYAEDINHPGRFNAVQGQFDAYGHFFLLTIGGTAGTAIPPSGNPVANQWFGLLGAYTYSI